MSMSKKGEYLNKTYSICSKINQFIYTLVETFIQTIRILAYGILQIFCEQAFYYTKCLSPKKENN